MSDHDVYLHIFAHWPTDGIQLARTGEFIFGVQLARSWFSLQLVHWEDGKVYGNRIYRAPSGRCHSAWTMQLLHVVMNGLVVKGRQKPSWDRACTICPWGYRSCLNLECSVTHDYFPYHEYDAILYPYTRLLHHTIPLNIVSTRKYCGVLSNMGSVNNIGMQRQPGMSCLVILYVRT